MEHRADRLCLLCIRTFGFSLVGYQRRLGRNGTWALHVCISDRLFCSLCSPLSWDGLSGRVRTRWAVTMMPMRCLIIAAILMLSGQAALTQSATAQPAGSIDMGDGRVVPGATWERTAPEAAGFSTARLDVLRAWLKTHQTTAMMVVYKGKVVFEYGDIARATPVASVRKSVLDMLFAAETKNLGQDLNYKTVVDLGLEDHVPFVHPEELANFEQLLASRSGIYIPNGDKDQDQLLPPRGSEYPGSHYFYNNWDFNALGTAFEKLTHKNIYDALRDDLAIPLGMQDFVRSRQQSEPSPPSIHKRYPMWLSTRDMARLGLLAIYGGKWGGKQLLDPGFFGWSVSLVTPFADINPTGLRNVGLPARWGYGRLWWVWDAPFYPGGTTSGPYQGAFTAMGYGGQFITVLPASELVVVHKVDIDRDGNAFITPIAYSSILDMVLDAKCDDSCQ